MTGARTERPASTARTSAGQMLRQNVVAWYWASRPFTLSASIVPVLVGSALAFKEGRASPGLFVLALVASVLVQVGTNLVDEYADHARPEGREKLLAPYKVIARGLLSGAAVKRGAIASFGAAAVVGLYLVSVTGWPILVTCLASVAVAYLYAGGPRPLGTLGLGQPLVFMFMGPVMVMGTYYVHARALTLDVLLLSVPVACTVTAILATNDLRDMEEDRTAGKTSPVTLFGRQFGRWVCTFLVGIAFLWLLALAGAGRQGLLALLPLLALAQAVKMLRMAWRGQDRPALAVALKQAARLHGWFGLLLAAGVALSRFGTF
ncbi:MAG: 1,4-dihydroxy-2-naphthoate octaprenyltransferase [Chloroflexi bacterium]|nr:1,4-dihydroxy-2-naphthoate octaprenyltransferase [Chloroflexota bacterium]